MHRRLLLPATLLLFATGVVEAAENKTTFLNGCVLDRSTNVIVIDHWQHMPRPFLNCSGLNKTSFNLSEFATDIESISLARNQLTKFSIRDLSIFISLKRLDLSHNKILTLEPLSKTDNVSFRSFQTLELSYNKLTEIPVEFFESLSEMSNLDISGNQIKTIKDDDFKHVSKLKILGVGSNPLEKISAAAFSSIADSLMYMGMPFCGLTEIPRFVRNMTKLMMFTLSNNNISNVQRTAFTGAMSLQWLELASNRIQRIDGQAFAGLEALTFIDLTDNQLETLPPGVFDSMTDQKYLSVEMYENPFRCNCSLKWMKMWMDKIHYKDVRYKCFQPLRNHGKKSYELNLSDYSCNTDDEDWTEASQQSCEKPTTPTANSTKPSVPGEESTLCPKKCTCYDSKGKQYSPPASASTKPSKKARRRFWWMGVLKYPHVDCTSVNLTKLPTNIRKDVKTITLEDNKIKTLGIAELKSFTRLEVLDLEHSGLTTFKPDVTTVLKNLTNLYLHRNNLTAITSEQLKSFPALKLLRLYDNKIKVLPANTFKFNRGLMRLYIGPNPIQKFDPKCLEGLKLYSLSLQNVSLKAIPKIDSQNLTYYDLRDNHITTISNDTFALSPNIVRLTLDNNRIRTVASKAFSQCTAMRSLDLSENRISTLPRGVFDNLNKERLHIELWANSISCDCRMRWLKQWIEELEVASPMTEIRFMCSNPLRMHGKTSEDLSPSDFICNSGDKKAEDDADIEEADCNYCYYKRGRCFSSGELGAAIILTMLFTIFACLIVKWCCNRKRSGYARYKPHDDTAELDMDM